MAKIEAILSPGGNRCLLQRRPRVRVRASKIRARVCVRATRKGTRGRASHGHPAGINTVRSKQPQESPRQAPEISVRKMTDLRACMLSLDSAHHDEVEAIPVVPEKVQKPVRKEVDGQVHGKHDAKGDIRL
jgi:hypothetical protein